MGCGIMKYWMLEQSFIHKVICTRARLLMVCVKGKEDMFMETGKSTKECT